MVAVLVEVLFIIAATVASPIVLPTAYEEASDGTETGALLPCF
jgi:hypothetical protein